MDELGVSDKQAVNNSSSGVVRSGVKVQKQNLEALFPSKTMMMMVPPPHNHHDPPLSAFDNGPTFTGGDGDGPTACKPLTNYTNHFVNAASASTSASGTLQPFRISTSTAFKFSGGVMAASLGFPFTNAQWKELERQAMIYKYMMASIPVPPHLLVPVAASRSPLDAAFNPRFSSSSDAEPRRCRRTDGKKWRCSRDVAPNHKYCERHMHRGRPRSRKHVEIQATTTNNQQINGASLNSPLSTPTVTISNSTISNGGSSSHFPASTTTSQPYFESSLSLDKLGVKAANFDSLASVSSNKEPRGLDWMLKGDPDSMDPEWHPLIQNKLGLSTGSSFNNKTSISPTHYRDPLHMNSYDVFSCELEQHNKRSPLYHNPLAENPRSAKARCFIDAWSNAEISANKRNSVASNGKLPLSSLGLSMGAGMEDKGVGSIDMGLGQMDPPATWVASSTPGGPLAEVLRPSKVATTTNETASKPSSPMSPMVTMGSSPSPSAVLHKTLASFSDSSNGSSPRVGSSRASSETALLCFNHIKLPSSS